MLGVLQKNTMNPLALLEKLINEKGSAAILQKHLEFAASQFADLERKVSELQTEKGRLEAKLEREQMDHQNAKQEIQRLKDERAEEIRIHNAVEFRKGIRTGEEWLPFCPKCHMPLHDPGVEGWGAMCSGDCGWGSRYTLAAIERMANHLEYRSRTSQRTQPLARFQFDDYS